VYPLWLTTSPALRYVAYSLPRTKICSLRIPTDSARDSTDSAGDLTDSHGFPRIPTDSHGFRWSNDGFPRIPQGSSWVSMDCARTVSVIVYAAVNTANCNRYKTDSNGFRWVWEFSQCCILDIRRYFPNAVLPNWQYPFSILLVKKGSSSNRRWTTLFGSYEIPCDEECIYHSTVPENRWRSPDSWPTLWNIFGIISMVTNVFDRKFHCCLRDMKKMHQHLNYSAWTQPTVSYDALTARS
jgi:hypothetical protein